MKVIAEYAKVQQILSSMFVMPLFQFSLLLRVGRQFHLFFYILDLHLASNCSI